MKSNFIKRAAILALSVLATISLPEGLFAKGAVIGYVIGNSSVTSDQLTKLTHIMAVDLYPTTVGGLHSANLPGWNPNQKNIWLDNLVKNAHANGVRVSIVIGHGAGYHNFHIATNPANLTTFVNNIVNFVNVHELDGVDIDWERPGKKRWYNSNSSTTNG